MKLHAKQKEVAKCKARFIVLNWGRRTGKSFFACEKMITKGVKRKSNIAYFATTQGHARDIMWKMLKERVRDIAVSTHDQRMEVVIPNIEGTTSTITLRGWENVDTVRGQNYDLVVLDEVAFMRNFKTGWEEALEPTLLDTKGKALFISTPKGYNHFYELYTFATSGRDEAWAGFHATSYDNPNVPSEEIDRIKESKDPDAFAQEYEAQFRKMSGLVIKAFDRRKHVIPCAMNDRPDFFIGGLDWGWHTTSLIDIYSNKGIYYIPSEYYVHEQTQDKTIDYAASKGYNKLYPDPEDKDANEMLKRAGINVYDVHKGKGSVEFGNSKLNELFLAGRLFIDPSCENLIWELENYVFDEKTDKIVKANDHAIDALRYGVVSHEKSTEITSRKPADLFLYSMDTSFDEDLQSPDVIV